AHDPPRPARVLPDDGVQGARASLEVGIRGLLSVPDRNLRAASLPPDRGVAPGRALHGAARRDAPRGAPPRREQADPRERLLDGPRRPLHRLARIPRVRFAGVVLVPRLALFARDVLCSFAFFPGLYLLLR